MKLTDSLTRFMLFLYPLKKLENPWFFYVFRGYKKRSMARNGLQQCLCQKQPPEAFCEKKVFLKISHISQKNTCWSLFFI